MRRPTAGAPAPRARPCRAARRYLPACPRTRELRSGPQPPLAAAGRSHGPPASRARLRPPARTARSRCPAGRAAPGARSRGAPIRSFGRCCARTAFESSGRRARSGRRSASGSTRARRRRARRGSPLGGRGWAAYAVARRACGSSVTEGWTGCARRGPSCETRCCGGARPTSRPGRSLTRANEARRRRARSRRPSRRPRGGGTRSSPEMCAVDSRGARAPPGGSAFLVKECWP
jgi:hypothetical protein